MRRSTLSTRVIGALAMAGLVVASAVSCGDDESGDVATTAPADTVITTEEATTTTEEAATTTEEATTTTEDATTTTEQSTTVVEDEIDISDFEGSWQATSYAITSTDDPTITIDVIALGAVLTAETDTEGRLTGQAEVPEALGGPVTLDFAATFVLVDQETMDVTFEPQIPPLLTDFTGPFSYDGTTITLRDEDGVFDFGDGAGEVPATAEVVLERTPAAMGVTISVLEPPREDGPFTASGEAVDEGVICAAGETLTVSVTDDEGQPPPWTPEPERLLVEMQFTCDDGSGQFTMQIAQPAYSDDDIAASEAGALMGEGEETWAILSGTDAYSMLEGTGTRTWQQVEPDLIETTYEGDVVG